MGIVRRWPLAVLSLGIVVVLAACSPHDQSAVVRDPATGGPMVVTGLCSGERVDAIRVRRGTDRDGPVVWEVQRTGPEDLPPTLLGSVPPGFQLVTAAEGPIPDQGWAEVSLSGGAASESGSSYDVASLRDLTQLGLDDLHANADANCAHLPFRSPWWETIVVGAFTAALFAFVARWARRSSRRPPARPALASPWFYLSAALGVMVASVLWPTTFMPPSSPSTYLLYGCGLSIVALALGLLGRSARRIRFVEWLIVVPGLLFVLIAGLLATIVGDVVFADNCGAGWTFGCTSSLLDRLLVLACVLPAWVTAVWIGEGGWWPQVRPKAAASRGSDQSADVPS